MRARRLLASSLLAGLGALAACDDSTAGGDADVLSETTSSGVVLAEVSSLYESCSMRHLGSASFAIDNQGDREVELVGIDFEGATSGGSLAFETNVAVPSRATQRFACHGGISGAADLVEPTSATLTYDIAGQLMTATSIGEHRSTTLFDNCDTGLPDIEVRPCALLSPVDSP